MQVIGPRLVIQAITGGNAHTFTSKRQRCSYARQINHIGSSVPMEVPSWVNTVVNFGPEDAEGVLLPHHDALVISAVVNDCEVRWVFVDGGSSADIMFASTLSEMGIPRTYLALAGVPLLGFGGKPVPALGKIELPVEFQAGDCVRRESIIFDVIDIPYQFNIILGRVALNKFGAISHHAFLCLKIPASTGVITVRGDQNLSRKIDNDVQATIRYVHTVQPEGAGAAPRGIEPPTSGPSRIEPEASTR